MGNVNVSKNVSTKYEKNDIVAFNKSIGALTDALDTFCVLLGATPKISIGCVRDYTFDYKENAIVYAIEVYDEKTEKIEILTVKEENILGVIDKTKLTAIVNKYCTEENEDK